MSLVAPARSSFASRAFTLLLTPVIITYGVWLLVELQRPDLLIVGNITVDLVDGTTPTGGAVSYAAVVAHSLQASSCVVTVAGPEADLDVFEGSSLFVIPANETLTFEHTYAWWGHSRRLRVTANPNITITKAHIPWRCRWARVVLLGPLTLHDLDAADFARHDGFWDWLINRRQLVGLMAQGFQRALGRHGEVVALPEPSKQLLDGLGPRVSLFLSDVETDTWTEKDLSGVVASSARVVITQGEKGATLLVHDSSSQGGMVHSAIPAVKVGRALDTNGAGDTFATMFMLALMRGDPSPGSTASWAASRAVLQPQTCKPRCAPNLITAQPGGLLPVSQLERFKLAVAPLLQHLAGVAAGPVKSLAEVVPGQSWLEQAVLQLEQWSGVSCTGRTFSHQSSSSRSRQESSDAGIGVDRAGSGRAGGAGASSSSTPPGGGQAHVADSISLQEHAEDLQAEDL